MSQDSRLMVSEAGAQRVRPGVGCPGCGAAFDDVQTPTHPYLAASPGCWASFGELQADELTRFGYPPVHGLVVDAYAAAHAGDGSDRRDRQSVCIHLIALCAAVERELAAQGRVRLLQRLTAGKPEWPLLSRPEGSPALDHTHLAGAGDIEDYTRRAGEWADAVWWFWSPHHEHIRTLLAER